MNENNLDTKINSLQTPIPSSVFYLGFIFMTGAVVGSLAGIMLTKAKEQVKPSKGR